LLAARKARQSSAYSAALGYVIAGTELLPQDRWAQCHDPAFGLELQWSECEFLTGALDAAEIRLAALGTRACDATEGAAVTRLRGTISENLGRHQGSIDVCLEYLSQHGIVLPAVPTEDDVQREFAQLGRQLGSRSVEELLDLPRMSDA